MDRAVRPTRHKPLQVSIRRSSPRQIGERGPLTRHRCRFPSYAPNMSWCQSADRPERKLGSKGLLHRRMDLS